MTWIVPMIALVGTLVLSGVLFWAGGAKLNDNSSGRATMAAFGVPSFLTAWSAAALPATELGLALALILPGAHAAAAAAAIGLFGLFGVAIARILALKKRVTCNCFGEKRATLVDSRALVRAALLAALAWLVALVSGAYQALWQGVAIAFHPLWLAAPVAVWLA
jgi:hypothetical protein